MAIDAKAKVELKGGPEAVKAIQGQLRAARDAQRQQQRAAKEQQRDAQRTAREQEKAAKQGAEAQKRASKDAERSAKQLADAQIREARRAEREVERIQHRESRRWQRLAEESRRTREVAEQQTARTRERFASNALRTGLRGAGRFLTAGTAGVLAGGLSAMGTARDVAGQADIRERIRSGNNFRKMMIITGAQAGVSDATRDQISGNAVAASRLTGKDIGEVGGSLELAQKSFNSFELFGSIIKEIAVTAEASGSNMENLVQALGFIAQANNLTKPEEMIEALNLMVAAAGKGSVEVDNFARDFAASAGIFATNTGQRGIEGVRQFVATSQGVATGGFGSSESATRTERLAADLQDVKVLAGLRGIGIKSLSAKSLKESGGKIDMGTLIKELSENKQFSKPSVQQGIFKEVRALQAVQALMAARGRVQGGSKDAVDYDVIHGMTGDDGSALTKSTFMQLENAGALDLAREAARMQADAIANLKSYNEQILAVLKVSNDLEQSFGTLSLWAKDIATGGSAAAGTALLSGIGGAGGSAAATGGGGALAARVASMGLLGTAGVWAAGLGAAGLTGYYGAKALGAEKGGNAFGKWLGDLVYGDRNEALNEEDVDFRRLRRPGSSSGTAPAAAAPERTAAPVVSELKAQTKELKRLNDNMEKRGPGAINQPARAPK